VPEPIPQILALGGGGFSMEPDNPSLDLYVLRQSLAPRPRVAFLGTATGDSSSYVANFYAAFSRYECRPSHLPLFARTPDLRAYLLDQDVIYVGGGNTYSMLAVWRAWGLPELLKEAWLGGSVLAGISAGAICWFEQGLTDSYSGELAPMECLGFLPGACCPHYDGEAERRPAYHHLLAEGRLGPGIALDDGVLAHYRGGQLAHVVSSRQGAAAYRLELAAGQVQETRLAPALLGPDGNLISSGPPPAANPVQGSTLDQ
jgi:peptidase E